MDAGPLLEMHGVHKRFGATLALRGVDLQLNTGEVLALVGENGAGKSTLMNVLSGVYAPDEGSMRMGKEPFRPRGPMDARQAGIAMIHQELSLAAHLSVVDNVLLGAEPRLGPALRRREARARTRAALDRVGLSDVLPSRRVDTLSPAQQQLVELARAVATGFRVLVLDEPTSSLGREDVRRLFELIADLRAQGVGIVYISHFLEEVMEISDRYVVLRDGQSVGAGRTSDARIPQIVRMMVGREVADLYPRSARAQGEQVLTIDAIAGRKLPLQASLTLHRGEVVGVAGLIGAGRTELLRSVFRLDPVRSGRVTIAGTQAGAGNSIRNPRDMWRAGVGMVSEDRKSEGLMLGRSIAHNCTLTRLRGLGRGPLVRPASEQAAAARWAEALSVRCRSVSQPINALSGGNQQKIAIARLLHHNADVLLLDEPTRGIDVGSKSQIYALIDRLASGRAESESTPTRPKAILIVSSYLPELLGVCDRIAVMTRGKLGPARPVHEWTEHTLMLAATGQEAAA